MCVCVCVCACAQLCLTLYDPMDGAPPPAASLARLICPWDFPSKNTGVGCHFILQGIFPTQGSNLHPLHLRIGRQILYRWATWEAHHPWMWEQVRRLLEMGQTIRHVHFVWQDWRKISNSLHQGCCIAEWISYICIYPLPFFWISFPFRSPESTE